jgi:hypothetical protein
MAEMVGSVGATLEPWSALAAAMDEATGGSGGVMNTDPTDHDLTWQTTVGQIIFLESVVPDPG